MINKETYNSISALCRELVDSGDASVVMGDAFGEEIAGVEAFDKVLYDHEERGKTEINAARPEVIPPFEWLYEITFRGNPFKHFLLQDEAIVETYGKNVIPVDQTGAEQLLKWLQEVK